MDFMCEQGWICEGCLMIDAYGWGIKGATCVLAINGSGGAVLVEAAHRKSAPHVLRELKRGDVKWILVTHRHIDHAGGVASMLRAFPEAKAAGHPVTLKNLEDPSKINEVTGRVWGELADFMDPVEDIGRLVALVDGDVVEVGGGVNVEAVHTPGHSSDHYAYYCSEHELIYLGDAGGLLSCSTSTVIPASFPSSFNFGEYLRSLDKLLGYEPKVVVFAHFGAVVGNDVSRIIEKCAETLEEWRRLAYELDASTLADELKKKYLEKFILFDAKTRNLMFDMLAAGLVNAVKKES